MKPCLCTHGHACTPYCMLTQVNCVQHTHTHTHMCTPSTHTLWAAGTVLLLSLAPQGAALAHGSCNDPSGSHQTAQPLDQTALQDLPAHSPDR